ncbi:hypothetical protein [Mycolicibacterium madagascariense]|uniref:hypothetical protein n=1 Tax=Mycolicibacterium madagascariense TaxID=212765 RepID=UPI0013D6AF51|nr:hypothetical protein [Mycolicibacterium madagascariense]MCV7014944.1 hypothetical protein [Mycolicibacterium madagascariense]
MPLVIQTRFATGVAMVGATALIAAPLAPSTPAFRPPDSHAATVLVAAETPIDSAAYAVAKTLVAQLPALTTPAQALSDFGVLTEFLVSTANSYIQSFAGAPQAIITAAGQVVNGDVNGAFTTLEGILLTPTFNLALDGSLQNAADTAADLIPSAPVANVVKALPNIVVTAAFPLLFTYSDARVNVVNAVSAVVHALSTLNLSGALRGIATGLNTITSNLASDVFGDGGVVSGLGQALQQIISAAFPPPAATLAGTATTKTLVAKTDHLSTDTVATSITAAPTTQNSTGRAATRPHLSSTKTSTTRASNDTDGKTSTNSTTDATKTSSSGETGNDGGDTSASGKDSRIARTNKGGGETKRHAGVLGRAHAETSATHTD